MEEERNARNNYDLVSAREGRALEIFLRIRRHLTAEVNRGMVWRTLASERAAEMEYNMNRLEAATGTDQSTESDGASQAVEGFGHHLIISGVCHRLISRGDTAYWLLENIWDTNYEWRSNSQRYVRISTDENITVWWRIVTDWSRPDGNMVSMQALWTGNFSNHERVLQLIEDVNTANSIQFLSERVTLNLHMRGQHIARFANNPLAAAFSAFESSLTVVISHEFVARSTGTGEEGDGHGWLCAICHEMILIGERAKQLPCNRNHTFHPGCIIEWLQQNLSCPLCRYEFK